MSLLSQLIIDNSFELVLLLVIVWTTGRVYHAYFRTSKNDIDLMHRYLWLQLRRRYGPKA